MAAARATRGAAPLGAPTAAAAVWLLLLGAAGEVPSEVRLPGGGRGGLRGADLHVAAGGALDEGFGVGTPARSLASLPGEGHGTDAPDLAPDGAASAASAASAGNAASGNGARPPRPPRREDAHVGREVGSGASAHEPASDVSVLGQVDNFPDADSVFLPLAPLLYGPHAPLGDFHSVPRRPRRQDSDFESPYEGGSEGEGSTHGEEDGHADTHSLWEGDSQPLPVSDIDGDMLRYEGWGSTDSFWDEQNSRLQAPRAEHSGDSDGPDFGRGQSKRSNDDASTDSSRSTDTNTTKNPHLDRKLMPGIWDALDMAHLAIHGVHDHLNDFLDRGGSRRSIQWMQEALARWNWLYRGQSSSAKRGYPGGPVVLGKLGKRLGKAPPQKTNQQRGAEAIIRLLSSMHRALTRYLVQTGLQSEALTQLSEGTEIAKERLEVALRKSIARSSLIEGKVWNMSLREKMEYQFVWIVWFIGAIVVMYAYLVLAERLSRNPKETASEAIESMERFVSPHDSFHSAPSRIFHHHNFSRLPRRCSREAELLVNCLWGGNKIGVYVDVGIVALSLLNFFTYIQMTEWQAQKDEYEAEKAAFLADPTQEDPGVYYDYAMLSFGLRADVLNDGVEFVSVIIFTIIAVLRLYAVRAHPAWRDFGHTAPFRYAVSNVYMLLDLIGLASSWNGLAMGKSMDYLNLLWLHFARSLEMLERSGHGLGVRALKTLIDEEGMLLVTANVIGLIIWLVLTMLYYVANVGNELLRWEAAAYDGELWFRFESIPSTSFFCLINLLKEHPLADAFTGFWQRVWVDVSVLFAMPIFALGTSILQYALFKNSHRRQEELYRSFVRDEDSIEDSHLARRNAVITGALALFSIERFVSFTARNEPYSTYFGLEVTKSTAPTLALIDGSVAMIFLAEYITRASRRGPTYFRTGLATIDLVAWLPGLLHLLTFYLVFWLWGQKAFDSNPFSEWLRACCVLRILKLERFLHSTSDLSDILWQRRSILAATLLLCMLTWMFFSQLLYLTDRNNPDEDHRENYNSVMRSLWAEMINLHGEYPWADYTAAGKPVMAFIGIFSIMIFCVPTSIFSDGFMERLNQDVGSNGLEVFHRRPWQTRLRPAFHDPRRRAYDDLYQHLHEHPTNYNVNFRVLRALNVVLVGATTIVTILGTVPDADFCENGEPVCHSSTVFRWAAVSIDIVAVTFFAGDLIWRTTALGWRHLPSLPGTCDLLSLGAILASLLPGVREVAFLPNWQNPEHGSPELLLNLIIPLRLLRMFSLESYFQAGHVLANVFYAYRWPLAKAGTALLHLWLMHATLLYLIERPGGLGEQLGEREFEEDEESDPTKWTMRKRYNDMPRTLHYSIIHLFGDFPETEYTFWAKVVHFIGIVYGIGIDAAFIGVVSSGFAHYLQEERRKRARQVALDRFLLATRVIIRVQQWWKRRKQRLDMIARVPDAASRQRLLRALQSSPREISTWHGILLGAREITFGKNWGAGKLIRYFFHSVLMYNLVVTMLLSVPELELEEFQSWEQFLLTAEFLCSLIFVAQYVLAVVAAPTQVFSFFRILDFLCLWPGFILLYKNVFCGQRRLWCHLEALTMFRAVRILDFGFFQKEVFFIRKAMGGSLRLLATPAYLAMVIWITTSSLFMFLENWYASDLPRGQARIMTSVPSTMYYCCILLIGEWVISDFTYAGSRLAIFYAVFAVALFAIPAGIMIEEIQSFMVLAQEEARNIRDMYTRADRQEKEATEQAEVELRRVASSHLESTAKL